MDKENKLILYKDDEGRVSVNTRFADEDVWLTQAQLVEIYQSSKSNISEHLTNIFAGKELEQDAVVRKFRTTAADGKNYQVLHYNLDVIIALGYRVQSLIAVRFRRWATQRLHEYIQKGFTMDDERLKQGGNRYFKELLQRIRDIRSSERNFYQQVTDIYATSTDYDPRAKMTKLFFATVQNKMHYAVHEHTAAELIYERVDNEKPFVGMTNFKGNYVTRDDVKIGLHCCPFPCSANSASLASGGSRDTFSFPVLRTSLKCHPCLPNPHQMLSDYQQQECRACSTSLPSRRKDISRSCCSPQPREVYQSHLCALLALSAQPMSVGAKPLLRQKSAHSWQLRNKQTCCQPEVPQIVAPDGVGQEISVFYIC